MNARSWLFVPGDSDRKLAKIEGSGADVVILDLEDSVAPEQKAAARGRVFEFLRAHASRAAPQLWVRINPLNSALAEADLDAVTPAAPAGIVQPNVLAQMHHGVAGTASARFPDFARMNGHCFASHR